MIRLKVACFGGVSHMKCKVVECIVKYGKLLVIILIFRRIVWYILSKFDCIWIYIRWKTLSENFSRKYIYPTKFFFFPFHKILLRFYGAMKKYGLFFFLVFHHIWTTLKHGTAHVPNKIFSLVFVFYFVIDITFWP